MPLPISKSSLCPRTVVVDALRVGCLPRGISAADAIDDAAGVIGVGQHLAIRIIRIGYLQQPVPGVVLVLEWGSVATPVPGPPAIWLLCCSDSGVPFSHESPDEMALDSLWKNAEPSKVNGFKMHTAYLKYPAFALLVLIAALVHWTSFELRYMWYPGPAEYLFLRVGYAICLTIILLLLAFFPSRLLVLFVATITFLFPPFLRGDAFVPIDWRFAIAALPSILLLVGVTELRLRL